MTFISNISIFPFFFNFSTCAVCGNVFESCEFTRYPNGVITHIECAKNQNFCPITGKLFNTENHEAEPKDTPGKPISRIRQTKRTS